MRASRDCVLPEVFGFTCAVFALRGFDVILDLVFLFFGLSGFLFWGWCLLLVFGLVANCGLL